MGAGDRKSRKGMRQPRINQPTEAMLDVDNHNFYMSGDIGDKGVPAYHEQMRDLAHLPSPLRRRDGKLNGGKAARSPKHSPKGDKTTSGTGSYRDQLRANGQRALQLSQEGKPSSKVGPPPPPTAPPALAAFIGSDSSQPPPPPSNEAHGKNVAGENGYMQRVGNPQQHRISQTQLPVMSMPPPGQWITPSSPTRNHTPCVMTVPTMYADMYAVPMSTQPMSTPNQWIDQMSTPEMSTPEMPGSPMSGLISSTMPQAHQEYELSCEELAAQLRAAAPACYED